jgi:hypothetical protein
MILWCPGWGGDSILGRSCPDAPSTWFRAEKQSGPTTHKSSPADPILPPDIGNNESLNVGKINAIVGGQPYAPELHMRVTTIMVHVP